MSNHIPHALLMAYLLGELDLKVHREVEDHLATCDTCHHESLLLSKDLAGISEALKSQLQPPPCLMERLEAQLVTPVRTRSWIPFWIGGGATIAAGLTLAFFLGRPIESVVRSSPLLEATSIVDSPLEAATSGHLRLANWIHPPTGCRIEGSHSVHCRNDCIPVRRYSLGGMRVLCYLVPSKRVCFSGMRQSQMKGMCVYCSSKKGKALVAFVKRGKAFLFTSALPEDKLTQFALSSTS